MLADDVRAEPVGSSLQGRDVVHGQKGVVVLAKADLIPIQFLLDEGVTIEIVGGVEGEERGYADDDGPEDLIAEVEVVMGEAACLVRQNPVIGILRCERR